MNNAVKKILFVIQAVSLGAAMVVVGLYRNGIVHAADTQLAYEVPDRTPNRGDRTPNRDRTTGAVIDDGVITAKVKAGLIADELVKAHRIDVETRNGEVMLIGTVENKQQAERAIQIAKGVEGVRAVTDKLKISKTR